MIANYIVTLILIPFIFIVPGLFLTILLRIKRSFLETISISFFLSFVIIGLLGILLKVIGFGLNFFIISSFLVLITILVVIKLLTLKNLPKISREIKFVILIFLIGYFVKVALQTFILFYPLGGDWFEHYQISSTFLQEDWKFADKFNRPPLFNYLIAFVMSISSKDLWVAQIVAVFLNSIFIFPFFLLAGKFFDKKVQMLSTVFVAINPLLTENALYIWPKNFVGFFILLFFYLLLKKNKNWFLLGGIAGLGLLTHQLSLFYILTGFFILYLLHRTRIFVTREFFTMCFMMLIFLLPWFLYTTSYKTTHTMFFYYPFAVDGYEKVLNATFSEVWQTFSSKPFYYIVGVRIANFLNTIFPVIPALKIINLIIPLPTIYLHKIVDISILPLAYHYFHSFPGNLTLPLSIFVFLGIVKICRMKKYRILLIMILLPFLFTDLFYGWIVPGLARQTLQPTIPLLILIGVWYVNSLKHRKFLFTLILLLIVVETAVFIYAYYDYFLSTWKFLDKISVLSTWTGQNSAYNIFFKISQFT
ncbi:MAG: glycosyltransferase family 39 protein [Candidatus Aenigmarchaeota archaeon]|nr:glycosyltransferase family 39 protein [Candidatus Aenigmarchaeota archaeon]